VLPFDHFEGDAEVVEDGHGKIVKQNSCQLPVASSRFLGNDKSSWAAREDGSGGGRCLVVLVAHSLIFEREQLCPNEEQFPVVVPSNRSSDFPARFWAISTFDKHRTVLHYGCGHFALPPRGG